MTTKTTKFIERSTATHGLKYTYTKAVYVNARTKICVSCPAHGDFFVTSSNHISRKSGCPKCAAVNYGAAKKNKAKATFVSDCVMLHGHKYTYVDVEYVDARTKVVIGCPVHGNFEMMPYCHRQGQGCPQCGVAERGRKHTLSQEEFIDRASKTHKDKYIYDYVEYHNSKTKVQIVCPGHGPFFQRPGSHVRGEGCPECGRESWFAEQGGYSQRMFDTNPTQKDEPGILYCVRFTSATEDFYKIGITKRSISDRFHWGYAVYDMEVMFEHSSTLYDVWTLEQHILTTLKSNRYYPSVKIGGYTECLSKYTQLNDILTLVHAPRVNQAPSSDL